MKMAQICPISFQSLALLLLLCHSTFASVRFTSTPTSLEKGKSYIVAWLGDGSEQYTLVLRKGIPSNLATIGTLTTTPNTTQLYTWTPSSTLQDGSDYALEIRQGTNSIISGTLSISSGPGGSSARTSTPAISATSAPVKETTLASKPSLPLTNVSTSGGVNLTSTANTTNSISSSSVASDTTLQTSFKSSTSSSTSDAGSSSPTNTASASAKKSEPRLSHGDKATIGVGVTVCTIILVWIGISVGKRSKKHKVKPAEPQTSTAEPDNSSWRRSEIDGMASYVPKPRINQHVPRPTETIIEDKDEPP